MRKKCESVEEYIVRLETYSSVESALMEIRERRKTEKTIYDIFIIPDMSKDRYVIAESAIWEKISRMGYEQVEHEWY